MNNRIPLGHTVVVLVAVLGCLTVVIIYAVHSQEPPPEIMTLIAGLATGSSASYLAPRPGPAAVPPQAGQTTAAGQTAPPDAPAQGATTAAAGTPAAGAPTAGG